MMDQNNLAKADFSLIAIAPHLSAGQLLIKNTTGAHQNTKSWLHNFPTFQHNLLNQGSLTLNDATTGSYIICGYGRLYIPHAGE